MWHQITVYGVDIGDRNRNLIETLMDRIDFNRQNCPSPVCIRDSSAVDWLEQLIIINAAGEAAAAAAAAHSNAQNWRQNETVRELE